LDCVRKAFKSDKAPAIGQHPPDFRSAEPLRRTVLGAALWPGRSTFEKADMGPA
jgi:hypothetical protein